VVTISVVIACKRAASDFSFCVSTEENNNSMRFWNNFRAHNVNNDRIFIFGTLGTGTLLFFCGESNIH